VITAKKSVPFLCAVFRIFSYSAYWIQNWEQYYLAHHSH
jgi:hypothetical protein